MTAMRDAAQRIRHSLRRNRAAWAALAGMGAIYFFSYFLRSAVPGTIFDELQTDFSLSAAAVAALGSVFLGVYAASQLVAGIAADRYGGRSVLLIGGAIMTFGSFWFALARTPHALYAARALTGFGASFMFLSLVQEVAFLFHHRLFAMLMSAVLFFGYLGNLAGTLPFALLVRVATWRWALGWISLALAMALGAAWVCLSRLPPQDLRRRPPFSLRPLWAVCCNPLNRPMFLVSLANFPVFFVIQSVIGKKFIQDVCGVGSERAASFTLGMASIVAGVTFLGGFWLRLARNRCKVLMLIFGSSLMLGMLVLALGVAVQAPPGCYLAGFSLIAVSAAAAPISSTIMKELNPPEVVSQAVSVTNALTYLGVSLLSWMAGGVLDWFEPGSRVTAAGRVYPPDAYRALFLLLGGLALLALLAMRRIPETPRVPCLNGAESSAPRSRLPEIDHPRPRVETSTKEIRL